MKTLKHNNEHVHDRDMQTRAFLLAEWLKMRASEVEQLQKEVEDRQRHPWLADDDADWYLSFVADWYLSFVGHVDRQIDALLACFHGWSYRRVPPCGECERLVRVVREAQDADATAALTALGHERSRQPGADQEADPGK